jgi:hypothetical protein
MSDNISRTYRTLIAAALIVGLAAACGGGGGGSQSGATAPGEVTQRIVASGKILAVADTEAAGVKKSKQYDVTSLTAATDAWLAFFGPDAANRKEFELRFYPSHESAVKDGEPLAKEGSGEGMKAAKDTQTWQEGAKNRWRVGGVTDVSNSGSRQAPGPKFGDYAIYGNLVLLCEGADSSQSLENCSGLIEALGGPKLKR